MGIYKGNDLILLIYFREESTSALFSTLNSNSVINIQHIRT
jgi:hypothetical protein